MGTHPIFESDFDCLTECFFGFNHHHVLHPDLHLVFFSIYQSMAEKPDVLHLNYMTTSLQNVLKTFDNCALVKPALVMKEVHSTALYLNLWHKEVILLIIMAQEESLFMEERLPMKTLMFVTHVQVSFRWLMRVRIQMDLSFLLHLFHAHGLMVNIPFLVK